MFFDRSLSVRNYNFYCGVMSITTGNNDRCRGYRCFRRYWLAGIRLTLPLAGKVEKYKMPDVCLIWLNYLDRYTLKSLDG
jgi:hypothetical protein